MEMWKTGKGEVLRGEMSCLLCILSYRWLLHFYGEILSWQLNIQTWIQEKGQDRRHKFGDINIWIIFKAVGMDKPSGACVRREKKRRCLRKEPGVFQHLRDHMERRASKGMVRGRRTVRKLWYLKH